MKQRILESVEKFNILLTKTEQKESMKSCICSQSSFLYSKYSSNQTTRKEKYLGDKAVRISQLCLAFSVTSLKNWKPIVSLFFG
ncbi:hypothetical protein Gasu2_24520 [Galdieria sulphuraria]|uniref:Uncharacterized protein n=1 Tax=Galdieria sulphuraria TaxID=130081 RepID=M2Y8R9_GALSU|nr:uncharacterized protein Gasu_02430 [Galdieria sulphuraria]EME32463.1 hypothetical protein Gasu_02430 [Galdieria sulphuraria]GJD08145.1 hypothetical protein Gasu2_24520 [Galdieria sulphuraria]|eukprot:XP_005708983.1 hypothetical protein Gasu_02430 [Galdieria sulphuraria]